MLRCEVPTVISFVKVATSHCHPHVPIVSIVTMLLSFLCCTTTPYKAQGTYDPEDLCRLTSSRTQLLIANPNVLLIIFTATGIALTTRFLELPP